MGFFLHGLWVQWQPWKSSQLLWLQAQCALWDASPESKPEVTSSKPAGPRTGWYWGARESTTVEGNWHQNQPQGVGQALTGWRAHTHREVAAPQPWLLGHLERKAQTCQICWSLKGSQALGILGQVSRVSGANPNNVCACACQYWLKSTNYQRKLAGVCLHLLTILQFKQVFGFIFFSLWQANLIKFSQLPQTSLYDQPQASNRGNGGKSSLRGHPRHAASAVLC